MAIDRIKSKDLKPPTDKCNARLVTRDDYCDNPAGMNTTHPGVGRCWKHDLKKASNPLGKNRYSDGIIHATAASSPRIITRGMSRVGAIEKSTFEEIYKSDSLYTLDNEIALLKTMLVELTEEGGNIKQRMTELVEEEDASRQAMLGRTLNSFMENVRQSVESIARVMSRYQQVLESRRKTLDVRMLEEIITKHRLAVRRYCADCPNRQRIAEALMVMDVRPRTTGTTSGGIKVDIAQEAMDIANTDIDDVTSAVNEREEKENGEEEGEANG